MEYWEMGTFGNTTLSKLLSIRPMFLIGLAGILLLRRQIELMSLSDNECRALGVRLRPVRAAVLALSTLMVGSIISVTGLISFAGLIAPHTARLMLRRNDSTTIIMSGLVGAFVVLTADILARVLYSAELPISILTTVIGVPILIYFLCARKGCIVSGLFSLDKVKISYGKNEIVHGVSMDIAKGEFCALLGLNGSGKTTILHACCGFLPMEGSCIAADTECKGLNEKKRARLISFIPQICSLQEDAPPLMWC